jgi:hypothetical protein
MRAVDIQTPAIIFPAISMLMLAYTNRFMVISQRIRTLYDRYRQTGQGDGTVLLPQIANLKLRITLIRWMQAMGAISFITCSSSILMLLTGIGPVRFTFGVSILLLIASLVIALWEITISTKAIEIELKDIEHALK